MKRVVQGLKTVLRAASATAACTALVVSAATGVSKASDGSGPGFPSTISGWQPVGQYQSDPLGQGLASVFPPGGKPYVYYTTNNSIPASVAAQGWPHIGDPDSSRGYLFDAYQGPGNATAKMFRVTTPSGAAYEYVHPLTPGEEMNNSFAAVSPNGQWLVSGEWGTMTRLLVFATPILNPATPQTGGTLPLAALCASDESDTKLFPTVKPLLEIDLKTALNGETVSGHVTSLGGLPLVSACPGAPGDYEVEGVDYNRRSGLFQVEVIPPPGCNTHTTIYEYERAR